MGYDKGHKEFHGVNMKEGFHNVPGYPWGFSEKILADRSTRRTSRQSHPHSQDRAGRVLDGAVCP